MNNTHERRVATPAGEARYGKNVGEKITDAANPTTGSAVEVPSPVDTVRLLNAYRRVHDWAGMSSAHFAKEHDTDGVATRYLLGTLVRMGLLARSLISGDGPDYFRYEPLLELEATNFEVDSAFGGAFSRTFGQAPVLTEAYALPIESEGLFDGTRPDVLGTCWSTPGLYAAYMAWLDKTLEYLNAEAEAYRRVGDERSASRYRACASELEHAGSVFRVMADQKGLRPKSSV